MRSAAVNRWWVHGRLDDLGEWVVETPVVVEMRNGEVLRVWDRKNLAVMETKGVREGTGPRHGPLAVSEALVPRGWIRQPDVPVRLRFRAPNRNAIRQ
jgi:hypothetical protein